MIVKKFRAQTETEAILMAKEEMGNEAIVINMKIIKPRGLKKLFQKGSVEITAALEEKVTTESIPLETINAALLERNYHEDKKASAIEEKLNNLQFMLEKTSVSKEEGEEEQQQASESVKFVRLIYDKLLENEVDEKYINQIIQEIEVSIKKETNLDIVLMGIYQKIVLKLGQPKTIELERDKTKVVFFMGPTGVGKTTTVAKLASEFKLTKKSKIALITSDTYRIAAVEQLRTYANILDVPLEVVYTVEELSHAVSKFKGYELILVDTAGRSHKNQEQCEELEHMINDFRFDENEMTKDTYLVLSAVTKYKDMKMIASVYQGISDYSLIFTKMDETTSYGNILNMKLNTSAPLSYTTNGQVVPDDISAIDAQKIAKALLGGNES